MRAAADHREWPVWLVCALLVGATLLGFGMAEGLAPARIAASAAIVLAAIKIHLVFDHYMELRWHHRPLRQALAVWLALVTAILLITYWA
jgi:Prokaryotic Cytochrome C oxidase subunit IV